MHFKSIRKKIIATTALVLFINAIIIIASITFITYQKVDKLKKQYLSELTLEKSRKLDIYLKNSTDFAQYLSTIPEIINWTKNPNPTNIQGALTFLEGLNIKQNYSALYILDSKGIAIISTEATFTNNDYSFRPYFKEAISGKSNMYVAVGSTSQTQGYYFSEPIKDSGGQIIGVLVLKLVPDSIYSIFDQESLAEGSHIMLTDSYGVVIYSDLKDRILSSLGVIKPEVLNKIKDERKFLNIEIKPLQYQGAQDELPKLQENEINIYDFTDKEDSGKEIITTIRVPDYSLFLIIENSSWFFSSDSINLAYITGLIVLLSELLILLALSVLISKNLKPLKALEKMANSITTGNLEIKNEIKSGDEIENLGSSFSKMTLKIKNYYSELEESVLDRTKELNAKNDYLNKTKLATLNILDDIQGEKNKTEALAKDLEKFKLALDNASDHIVITDADGIVLYGNNGVERITGYKLSEALGKKAGVLWSMPMPKEYYTKLWKTIKTDKKTYDGEIKNKRKNGEIYDAKITVSPVLNDKKEVEFFIAIERDITHEKMVDLAKTEFVSLASHQLRTPLSSVNWYAEMLLAGDGGKLNNDQTGFVQEIYNGNQRMVELVNSLLNVSRLELGTFAVEPAPTDIVKMAEDVLKELKPGIIQKKLKINFKHDKDIPIIEADPKLFRIVYQNLLSNAIKYTPEAGSVSLKISKDTKNILIEVADTGYGIPKQEQSRIFQKLFRAENVRAKDTEGTGLGLYIVKSIIDHAGGKITFESEEDKGTTFYLEIPLTGMKKKEGDKKIE